MYTDAEGEESLISALEDGDFDLALQLLPSGDGCTILRVGPDKLTPLHYACQHGRLDIIQRLVQDHMYDLNYLHSVVPNPLQIASASGHSNIVDYLVKNTANLTFKPGRVNCFHLAADNGHVNIMTYLLSFSSSLLSIPDQNGDTPLHHACAQGFIQAVVFLCDDAKHPLVVRNKQGETPLHLATKYCHFEVVKFLIDDKGYDPTMKDSTIGCTPLHLAARSGCLDIVQYLAGEKGCNFESKTSHQKKGKTKQVVSGRTPLHYASYGGHCDIVTYLIEEQLCNPCCTDEQGFTPLHLACQEGHSDVVRYLLSLRDIELHGMVNEDGLTPIHAASLSGNLEIMKLLIDQNEEDPSIIDSEGRTALHYSARKGHTNIAQYLVTDNNFAVNCVDQSQVTSLHLAAQYGHLDTVRYLVTGAQANPNMTEENGYTALHLAANKGRLDVVEFLVGEKHISCMVRDKAGRTPLHHACQAGHLNVVQYLTGLPDCDPSCQEKNLKASPLHLAASFGHVEVVRYLVEEKNCSPTCTDKFNSTPIHRAATSGHCDTMSYFIKVKQCSPLLKNKFGNTPLHLACQKGRVKMVELLLSFSKENMTTRNQVGRMPLDLTESTGILSIFLKNGIDPSKGSITSKFPYLKCWDSLTLTAKIFLLGDLDSGKSTLAKALQGGGFFQEWVTGRFQRVTPPDSKSSGIIPITFGSKHFGRVILYDFAGHPCYHASHCVIMDVTSRGSEPIFIITVDLRKSPENIEKSVAYWCTLILLISRDFQPHLILVGTHEDELSKDGLRHKPALLEKIAMSNGHKFSNWITIDCRKPNSANFHRFRQFISQRCDTLSPTSHLDHKSCLLRSFMLHKFQGTSVIEFEQLLEYISHANIPDIKDKNDLHQACQALHSYGYILFLESKDSMESSWVVHNQEAILSMVHGFHKLVEIPNPLGLVSVTQLQIGLGSMGFNITLAIRYLLRMEFCIKLADRRVLHSISGFKPPHPMEDHLFFPHLIRSSAPPDLWDNGSTSSWDARFGWCMECTEPLKNFGPRFLQLLILRLASQYCFNTNPNSPFGIRRSSCVIWRQGLSWFDSRGIEAVVELRKGYRVIIFLCRSKSGKQSLDFSHFRTAIIQEVRKIRSEACSRINVAESIIHPDSLVQKGLFEFDSKELNLHKVGMTSVYGSLLSSEPAKSLVQYEQTLKDTDSQVTTTNSIELLVLVDFEPFFGLPYSVLALLFNKDRRSDPILDEAYEGICTALSENRWDMKQLLVILNLPHSSSSSNLSLSETVPASSFRAIFHRWCSKIKTERTYGDLWTLFSTYSVIDESDAVCYFDSNSVRGCD
jgi:ankyrin repeat protein